MLREWGVKVLYKIDTSYQDANVRTQTSKVRFVGLRKKRIWELTWGNTKELKEKEMCRFRALMFPKVTLKLRTPLQL